jgi:hypothetical protein
MAALDTTDARFTRIALHPMRPSEENCGWVADVAIGTGLLLKF